MLAKIVRSISLFIVLVAVATGAETFTWTGTADTDWFNPANWEDTAQQAGVPGIGDSAVIASGSVWLTNITEELASFHMTGGTLTFSNWTTRLRAGDVSLDGDSTVTLPPPFTDIGMSNRVWFVCQNDFYLGTNAVIDAAGRGFAPGFGDGVAADSSNGSGHGGQGGRRDRGEFGVGGSAYGVTNAPVAPGSGGRLNASYGTQVNSGGGAVLIQAGGKLTIDGMIDVDGKGDTHGWVAAGSGGSIYLICGTFAGSSSGQLRARGGSIHDHGSNTRAGAGAGGRIAVDYTQLDPECAVRFTARRGWSWIEREDMDDHKWWVGAQHGTLWLPDTGLLSETLTDPRFDGVRLYFGGAIDEWRVDSLTIENNDFTLAQPGFKLFVTNSAVLGSGAHLTLGTVAEPPQARVDAAQLTLEDGGILTLISGEGDVDGFGAELNITGALTLGADSWLIPVAHPYDGGTVRCVAGSLSVAAQGGINANGRGYAYNHGDGRSTSGTAAGAGYGGRGGIYQPRSDHIGHEGLPYGNPAAPRDPGSGNQDSFYGRAYGGGAIWLEIDGTVAIDGVLTAKGGKSRHQWISGGSGGGIYVNCQTFAGGVTGLLDVEGGTADRSSAGGGGRIAVDYVTLDPGNAVRFSAAAGERGPDGQHANLDRHWWWLAPQEGTLWLPDTQLLTSSLADARFANLRLIVPGFTEWTVSELDWRDVSLTLETEGGDKIPLTVTGDIKLENACLGGIQTLDCGGNLTLTNGAGMGMIDADIGGDLRLLDGSYLSVHAQATNGVTTAYGALVNVGGLMRLASNAWVYPFCHPEDGGAPRFRMRDLQIDAGSGFNADSRGFANGFGPQPSPHAFTGAGHGGHGGQGHGGNNPVGQEAGNPYMPRVPGSGTRPSYVYGVGRGGGVVWIEAEETMSLDGTIQADAASLADFHSYPGSGAGGGVFIAARRFTGGETGSIRADGGNSGPAIGGGGGGGRVAVWMDTPIEMIEAFAPSGILQRGILMDDGDPPPPFEGSVSVAGGTGWADNQGSLNEEDYAQPGSIHFLRIVLRGTLLRLR